VYRCLLGMADTKPQRRRLTTRQQLSQRPVTTPLRLQSITPQLKLPRATTPSRYRSTTRKRTSHPTTPGPKYYSVSSYYTEASANYSTKTVEYYTESPKYYSAPIYTTTTEAAKYYAVPTYYYTEAAPSY
jgi:hypothetical protein